MKRVLSRSSAAQSRKSGFTLIELLVVIAIIAILASILFPVFARARENARRSSCQSNLKQLGLGIMQYTQDYDEKLPGYTFNDANMGALNNGHLWAGSIYPYVKSSAVYTCPSDSNKPLLGRTPVSYAYNNNLNFYWNSDNGYLRYENNPSPKANISGVVAPAKTVMLMEITGFGSTGYSGTSSSVIDLTTPLEGGYGDQERSSLTTNGVRVFFKVDEEIGFAATGDLGGRSGRPNSNGKEARHLGTSNFLMADGHVKAFQGSKVSSGRNALAAADAQEPGNTVAGGATPELRAAGTDNTAFAVTFSAS